MILPRAHVSRRLLLRSATALLAAGVGSSLTPLRQPERPLAPRAMFGPAEFVPTVRVDPRTYLKRGQLWTTVACIRPAFQAALDEAHRIASSDASAVVELVIPPGVGRLTTAASRTPVNRSSSTVPKSIYSGRIGFGLRSNLVGRIIVKGSGGQSRASVIRLSQQARNLFWIDTDTGVTWRDTGAREPSGGVVERPAKPLIFRNVMFTGFAVDDNESGGTSHIVCGTMPSSKTPQRYVSIQNVHASDIDVWCSKRVADAAAQELTSKAAFAFVARHFSNYEGNGGPGRGSVAGHAWKGWDLGTIAGRAAAHSAGWTWMTAMSFDRVRATNTNRGILVAGEPHEAFSLWVDDISMTSSEHRQDRPYTTGNVPQTSFFIGGSCQGGTATIDSCTSVNVGDDAVEIGGMQNATVRNLTCVNACLAGVYLMYAQPPLDWATTKVVIEDSTFVVDASAIQPKQPNRFRSVPIDAKFDKDAAPYALGELQITRCTTTVDGSVLPGSGLAKGVLDKLHRKDRYGWFLTGPVAKAVFTACVAVLSNVELASTSAARRYPVLMWHAQQKLPDGLPVSPSLAVNDCIASVSDITTRGAAADLVVHSMHSAGTSSTDRFTVDVTRCGRSLARADLARVGWRAAAFTATPSSTQNIRTIRGTMTATQPRERAAVAVFDDQRVDTSLITGVAYAAWGAGKAVDTTAGPSNGKRVRTR